MYLVQRKFGVLLVSIFFSIHPLGVGSGQLMRGHSVRRRSCLSFFVQAVYAFLPNVAHFDHGSQWWCRIDLLV
ncbi:hypothetical protein GQ53DRAFT_42649 [Thozetella sp. PMI_491]|nr:hypothetical protein GQ53DRAFT_42649 [Thozetella sp. PMI_491]